MAESWRETRRAGSTLPWSASARENRRFALILGCALVLFLPVALLIPRLELPEVQRAEAEKVPPSLARLVQAPTLPEPPRPVPQQPESTPEPTPEPVPEPRPEPAIAKPPKPTSVAIEEKPSPAKPKPVQQTAQQARERAARSGLLAMKSQLASLRVPAEVERLQANTLSSGGEQEVSEADAEILRGSGGVSVGQGPEARVDVQGHQVQQVAVAAEPQQQAVQPRVATPSVGERAMSNIRRVFDAQKTALYSLYRRELRQDPTLAGKVMLELTIEPDGTVSACQVVSSDLQNQSLEQRIAMRVRLFNFGTEQVEVRKVRFPIDFLPG